MFWAGTTFVLARNGAQNVETLFGPQMGAGAVTILAGAALWALTIGGADPGWPLKLGALAAIVAIAVQIVGVGPIVRHLADSRRRVPRLS